MGRIKNIIVDLDGTLIDFDSSFKMWKSLFRLNFFPLLKVLFIYIVYGEARAKSSFHKISTLNYTLNQNLLQYLYKMKQEEHNIVLATGANEKIANQLNKEYELFHNIIASDKYVNCIGIKKLAAIKKLLGKDKFMYIGDHWYDFPIWKEAHAVGVMKPNQMLLQSLTQYCQLNNKALVIFD